MKVKKITYMTINNNMRTVQKTGWIIVDDNDNRVKYTHDGYLMSVYDTKKAALEELNKLTA